MFEFRGRYLLLTIFLLSIEIAIALFVNDRIIRPYIGDILVAILVYCFIRSFFNLSINTAAIVTIVFSYSIEILQYFNIVKLLGLQNSKIAGTAIGQFFDWMDLLMYTFGILVVLAFESRYRNSHDDRKD